MAARVYLNMAYVVPRALLWIVLLVAALVDGIRHRAVHSRGCVARAAGVTPPPLPRPPAVPCFVWFSPQPASRAVPCRAVPSHRPLLPARRPARRFQLYWALVGSAALFVVQEVVLVVLAAQSSGQNVNHATLGAYIFFADLAVSYWMGILLLVAAGFW